MKKFLLLVTLLVLSQVVILRAQRLFSAPDTVCVNQPVTLLSKAFDQSSYYWGFCSGYLANAPVGYNLGNNFGFHIPTNIDIVLDSGNYYGFVLNSADTQLIRLNFGNSLTNVPTVTNFGNLTFGLSGHPTSQYLVHDTLNNHWFLFVCGGFTNATSSLSRLDFGAHLSNNSPNIANFGNYQNVLDQPRGLFVAQDDNYHWYGFVVNQNTSELVRMDFSFNVSNTPLMASVGNISNVLGEPTDMAALKDDGLWYLFVTNKLDNTVARLDLGTGFDTIATDIKGFKIADFAGDTTFNFRINWPSSISINKDCGDLYAYVTDSTTSQLIGIQMATARGGYVGIDYVTVGGMNFPSGISSILRDGDNLYGFVVNARDSTLTQLNFTQCFNSSIPSFTSVHPPVYSYDTPGVYNVYFVINQGKPDMDVDCKEITVLPNPLAYINPDDTICVGDTLRLYTISNAADSIRWLSNYNIDTTNVFLDSVKVYPGYDYTYNVKIYYPYGCIVDTAITIKVNQVDADAGPDRWIKDGAKTTIGGPYTTTYGPYKYRWEPYQFMSDSTVTNPVVYPPYDYTYYLTVTDDSTGCIAKDTVVVKVNCGEIYVPNAFAPNSASTETNRFGIINNDIVKLNYFRIYDRWGELVFETNKLNQSWDGTYNGQPSPVGVYVWIADAFCQSGKRISKQGNVSLLR